MEHIVILGIETLLLVGLIALSLHDRFLLRGQVGHLGSEVARLEAIVASQQLVLADLQTRLVNKDRLVTESREQAVTEFRAQIDGLRRELDVVKSERSASYDHGKADGKAEAMSDYAIIAQPFSEKVSGWFKNSYRAGYRFQLLVKGSPAYDARTVIFTEIDEVDAKVKRTIVAAAQQALALVAKAQGIPVHFDMSLIDDP